VELTRTSMRAQRAMGISIHTGWAACVVVGGSRAKPEIVANEVIEILDDSERFCFHMAAQMERAAAEKWIARAREKAVANARRALAPLVAQASACAIVAKDRDAGTLDQVLASHPRIHTAEGCFYRDVLREACAIRRKSCRPCPSIHPRSTNSRRRRGDGIRRSPRSPPGKSWKALEGWPRNRSPWCAPS
jgi:hypothetical protein